MGFGGESNIQWIDKTEASPLTALFNINAPQFLALATQEQVVKLKKNLIKINIQEALNHLKPEGYFEITLPVLGMADFLSMHKHSIWNEIEQPFASILSINGWGSGLFSRPDFIMVRDLVGNEYEILVDSQGQVETPTEGTGLFSMLSEITLMYSADQIKQGRGFQKLSQDLVEPHTLYLLPPPHMSAPFVVTVRATHLEGAHPRQVDFEEHHFFAIKPSEQHAGLTEFGARWLIRHVFSEFEFIQCVWRDQGTSDFGILHHNRFNDFRLRHEALALYYNLLVRSVIHQRLPYEFILSKVPGGARYSPQSLVEGPFDQEDRRLIQSLGVEALRPLCSASPRIPAVGKRSTLEMREGTSSGKFRR